MEGCPNVIPGTVCVDPECTYCKIAAQEGGAVAPPRPEDPN